MESNTYFSTHGFLQHNHRLKIVLRHKMTMSKAMKKTIGLQNVFKTKGYELVMSLLDGNNNHKL